MSSRSAFARGRVDLAGDRERGHSRQASRTRWLRLIAPVFLIASLCSSVVLASPAGADGLPSAPNGLAITAGNQQVSLSWNAPYSDGGNAVSGYDIYEGTSSGGESATPVNATPVAGTSTVVTGLTTGTHYYFVVKAINAAGMSSPSNEASAYTTAPGPPIGLTATGVGRGNVSLAWSAPSSDGGSAIIGYDVYMGTSSGGESSSPYNTSLIVGTSYSVGPIDNGTTYYFVVVAVNAIGVSAFSNESAASPYGSPSPPTGLTATPGDGQVSLTWNAPSADGGIYIDQYLVFDKDAPQANQYGCAFTSATSCVVTGLSDGTTYTFVVLAHNIAGYFSGASNQVSAAAGIPGRPSPPTGLATTAGVGQVSLSWNAPLSDGGNAVTGYDIYEGTSSGGESATPVNATPVAGTSTVVTGLTTGTHYYFVVTAINATGLSPSSNEASAYTTVPATPTGLTAAAGTNQVSLHWTVPTSDGGSAITGYDIFEGTSSGGESATPVNASPVAGTSFVVSGLNGATSYYFVVEAVNAVGISASSQEAEATTPNCSPSPPTGLTATPGDGQVSLSWTAPALDGGSPIVRYDFYSGDPGMDPHAFPYTCTFTSATACVVTGLTDDTTYTFDVLAQNAVGFFSAGSNVASAIPVVSGTASAPTGLAATVDSGQVELDWTPPSSDGGNAITGYDIYEGTSSGAESATPVNSSPVTGTSSVVTGLENETYYYFFVRAINAAGVSLASSEVSAFPSAPGPLGAPKGVVATAGPGQVSLTWTAPSSDGGRPISGYDVYLGTSPGGESSTPLNTSPITGTTYNVTGLDGNITYYFVIKTMNTAEVSSLASAEVSATPSDGIHASAPKGLTASVSSGLVSLSWTTPSTDGGNAITGYNVYLGTSSGGESATPINTTPIAGTSYGVNGLTGNVEYYFEVTAVNAGGVSPFSNEAAVIVRDTNPSPPTGLTATAGAGQVSLTWTAPAGDGGSPIIRYFVYNADPGLDSQANEYDCTFTSATSCVVTGLTTGSTYSFVVLAENSRQYISGASSGASAVPIGLPGSPTIGTATAGDTTASVSFAAPVTDGGSTITGYTVTATDTTTPANGGQTASGSISPIAVAGLTNGDSYTFSVAAINAIGTGPSSAPSVSVTPGALSASNVVFTSPGTVTVLAGKSVRANIRATGAPMPTISAVDLPPWLSFTFGSKLGKLRGTAPAAGGVFTFTLTGTNSSGSTSQTFTVDVLAVSSPPAASFTVGVSGSFTVTTVGGVTALSAAGLPAGLTFTDHGDGTATITGTPTAKRVEKLTGSETKSFKVRLTARSGPVVARQTLDLTVRA